MKYLVYWQLGRRRGEMYKLSMHHNKDSLDGENIKLEG
jgi:hypothetical protein